MAGAAGNHGYRRHAAVSGASRRALAGAILTLAALIGAINPSEARPGLRPDAALQRLFSDEWTERLRDDPLFATAVGVHDYDDRLPAVAPADFERQARETGRFLERLSALRRARLAPADQLDYDLFDYELRDRLALARFRDWRIPLTSDSGFHTEVLRMADGVAMPRAADVERYIARLEAVPAYFDQQVANLRQGLERGYATATTDTGHLASDQTWGTNRAKEVDYGHRGTHVTTVASKDLTTAFYGKPLNRAYFNGCSNGGRQALMEVQRYPTDFDAIIAGDPATGTPMQMGRGLVFQKMLASTEAYLPQSKVELISNATLAACDATDGLKDGLITDPTKCTFRIETLKCKGGDGPNCLNAKQLEVVQQIYNGYKLPNGEVYAWGFPFGHEGSASGWQAWINGSVAPTKRQDGSLVFTEKLPSGYALSDTNFKFLSTDEDDPTFDWRTFDLARALPRLKVMTDILSPLDPDLRPFKAHGGKLLMYHGWSDPAISALGTVDYFNKVGKVVGSQQELDAFVKLFLVPGMHHCSGGPGPNEFDALTALENWSEKGQPPAMMLATHKTDGKVDRTRPLCPHPQVATYKGSGSVDDAANFICR